MAQRISVIHVDITRKIFFFSLIGFYNRGGVRRVWLLSGKTFIFNPYPTAFPYGNGMVLHFYQQQESSTTKTVHKVINKGLKAYV